jgi:membrane protein
MSRFVRLLRRALWLALEHDQFGIAKAAAYSAILTLFPGLLLIASILATSRRTETILPRILAGSLGRILPGAAAATAQAYFEKTTDVPIPLLISASLIALWTASGLLVSWMQGFRAAYGLPVAWGLVKERFIAFGLVIMALVPLTFATFLVAFGNQIESWIIFHSGHEFGTSVLLIWASLRWLIAILTSIAVMLLVYHFAVPRTLAWQSVLPGAVLTTAIWFPVTLLFGWYVGHYAEYSLLYGSLATAVVLLVWMYILSVIVLIGAEFNALVFPRAVARNGAAAAQPVATH